MLYCHSKIFKLISNFVFWNQVIQISHLRGYKSFSKKHSGLFENFICNNKTNSMTPICLFIFSKHIIKPIFSQIISKFCLVIFFMHTNEFFLNNLYKFRQFSTTNSLENSTATQTFYDLFEEKKTK